MSNSPRFVLACVLAAICLTAACRSAPAASAPTVSADTWAVVDGKEITRADVDKAFRRARDVSQTLSTEEDMTVRLNLLNELIVQEILRAKAATLKIDVAESDLNTAFNNAKKNMPDEAFQQELTRRGLTTADLQEGLRRELLTQKVIDQEVGSKITVTDQETSDFFNANRAQFNVPEEAYHIAQIVVTPVREGQRVNGTGDDAATPQEAAAKTQMLMERLKAGASFQELAAGYSEDPESAPRGGDLGLVPVARLRQAPPALRDAVINKPNGNISVVSANGAHTIVLVVSHEAAGQRDLSNATVKDRVTQTLRGRKEQLLRTAYLAKIQDDADIVNYLARRLVEAQAKTPSLLPVAPVKQ